MDKSYHFINETGSSEDEGASYNAKRDFTTLKAWKKARKLKLYFYSDVLLLLSAEGKYGLNSQIRRTSVSTTANIAEGYGRFHYQEGVQFYRISRASMYELKDHLITCIDLKYVYRKVFDQGIYLIEEAKKTLNEYIRYVKNKKAKT